MRMTRNEMDDLHSLLMTVQKIDENGKRIDPLRFHRYLVSLLKCQIGTEQLKYGNWCSRWLPKILTDIDKNKRLDISITWVPYVMREFNITQKSEVQANNLFPKNHVYSFLGQERYLLVLEFLHQDEAINAVSHCETMRNLPKQKVCHAEYGYGFASWQCQASRKKSN